MDAAVSRTEFHTASVDGVDLGCYVEGAGPALLMMHGVAIDHSCFDRARPELAKHFTLYMMDRRGRGISGDSPDWTLEREFDDVHAMIEAIAREAGGPINVFAHSLGGLCALEAASRSNNVRRLFLYDPAIPKPPRAPALIAIAAKLQHILDTTGDRELMIETHLLEWTKISPESLARQKADKERWTRRLGWAHTIPREYKGAEVFRADTDRYRAIRGPTRVMVGEKSHEGLQVSARTVIEKVPGSDLIVFAGAAHYGFNTAPGDFASQLVSFFTEEKNNG